MNDGTEWSLPRAHFLRRRRAGSVLAACALVIAAGFVVLVTTRSGASPRRVSAVPAWSRSALGPATPPVRVCGNRSVLGGGPAAAPRGAVRVAAGDDFSVDFGRTGTTYWFAPGVHTLGPSEYAQIVPGAGSTYLGAPGAVLDGRHANAYAFGGWAADVTISYLTVQNFGAAGGNQNQGVVNEDSATGWTIEHSTVRDNAGAGVMLGSRNTLAYDCLADNEQYGFNAYSPSGVSNLLLDHDEIAGNDTYNWEERDPGCGCTGGGKFWDVDGATITDDWIHGNRSAGLWADTNNRGFAFEGNYISGNYSYGLIYEISYNALVEDNTFVRNGLVNGPRNPTFPTSAIYLSESGSDARVPGPFGRVFLVARNTFLDNWGGVVLWENANRFCNSPANTSTTACTLVDPGAVTLRSCDADDIRNPPYYADCRWKTQNVLVEHDVFDFDPAHLGATCTWSTGCGFQGLFSEYGTYPSWSPYQQTVVEGHIAFDQNDRFTDNLYAGPWQFMAYSQGNVMNWQQWRRAPYRQDAGSTLTPRGK